MTAHTITAEMFGGNLLFDRDSVQFADNAARLGSIYGQLGLTTLRYPGGTISETLFNFSDPDSPIPVGALTDVPNVFDPDWNGPLAPRLLGLTDALRFCAAQDLGFTFVMPSIRFAGSVRDADGNRQADVDEGAVRAVMRQMLTTALELGVEIEAIELGNEWWRRSEETLGETLSAVEYGRIASRLAAIVQDTIDNFRSSNALPSSWTEPDIAVQVGLGGGGDLVTPTGERPPPGYNGPFVSSTELIFGEFDTLAEKQAVDGILTHFYPSSFSVMFINGSTFDPFDKWDALAAADGRFQVADRFVTEWNVMSGAASLSGKSQGAALLEIFAEMANAGVDHANVWAIQQHMDGRLASSNGTSVDVSADLTFAGDVFALMSSSLVGAELQSMTNNGIPTSQYVYTEGRKTIVFLASNLWVPQDMDIDLSDIGHGVASVQGVSVTPTEGRYSANAIVSSGVTEFAVSGLEDWAGTLRLAPYEVVRLIFNAPRPTPVGGHDVRGRDGVDNLTSNRPESRLLGMAGNDTLRATQESQTLIGGTGRDTFVSSNLGTTALGGPGRDVLRFSNESDGVNVRALWSPTPSSGSDDWTLVAGIEQIFGTEGDDTIIGSGGAETMFGGRGDDDLAGGGADDRLFGGGGRDDLSGGRGDDVLTGGQGADVFRFSVQGGDDVWTDFDPSRDRFGRSNDSDQSLDSMIVRTTSTHGGVTITMTGGGSVFLRNVSLRELATMPGDQGFLDL